MGDIHQFKPGIVGDGHKIDPEAILVEAAGNYESIVIIGIAKDGVLDCQSSDGRHETIALIERAKAKLIASFDD